MSGLIRHIYYTALSYETRLRLYKLRNREQYQHLRSVVYPSPKGDFSLKPFDEHNCIFVHITKTAGTSVAKGLFGYLPYHYTAIDYRVIYDHGDFKRYFKFAFVRNPWDRLYSAFRYLKAGGWDKHDRAWAEAHLGEFDDFNSFVQRWLSQDNINKHKHFWPQYYFICDPRGRLLIDYLAYFETLEEDFGYLVRRLGMNAKLGSHNTNPGTGYQEVYDEGSRQIVAEIYAKDIELFGYDFYGLNSRTAINKNMSSCKD